MNIDSNLDTTPDQPDENSEIMRDYPEYDVLNVITDAVTQISDADIEDRLRRTLHRAGYSHQYQGGAIPELSLFRETIPGHEERLKNEKWGATATALPQASQAPSWEEIVRTHTARVYRLAYRLTGNPHDAEDLTLEVFVRVLRSQAPHAPRTFEAWLHRITTSLFLDRARHRERIRFEILSGTVDRESSGTERPPTQAWDVQAALLALPPDYRAAVVLCDIEGFSYVEIAATMGVKLGTVRNRIHRGRTQLRAALSTAS